MTQLSPEITAPAAATRVEPWQLAPPPELVADPAPRIPTENVPACPVCSNSSFKQYALGFDYELRTCSNTWRFVQCDACTHIWLNPRPAVSTLATIYPPHYYAYEYTKQVHPLALKAKNALDTRKFRGLVRAATQANRPLRSFADIGCGDGRYLRFAHAAGVPKDHVFGLELDQRTVDGLRAQGFQAFCERAETCTAIPDNSLDLATMFHVIEHVDDPKAVARRVADWIAPGGIFAVETPNIDSLDARLFRRTYWGGYHIPRHWNLFSPTTLARLLTDAGLEVIGTRFQTGHSFWMYSMHHLIRYHGGSRPRLAKLFDPMGGFLPFLAGFTMFDKMRAAIGLKTSSMLMLARKR